MPTKTYPDETVSVADLDAYADDTNVGVAFREQRLTPSLFVLIDAVEDTIHRWLRRYSVAALRISLGLVALGFGVLKYFPGVSPAQDLVLSTVRVLTFGLVPTVLPNSVVMALLATVECGIGLCLITGRWLRVAIYITALWVMGILLPLAVLPGRLFGGPDHAPTLEGQYVLTDVVLLAAVMVVASTVGRRSHHR